MKFLVCTLLSVLSIFASFANGQSTQEFSPRTIQPDLTCSPAPCRLPNVRVTSGKKVSDTAPNLAINPQNPSQMILGVVDTSCASWGAAYHTNDGGMTWTKVCLPVAGSIDVYTSDITVTNMITGEKYSFAYGGQLLLPTNPASVRS